ncbi:hypothetical protein SAMN02745116_02347 [Pilibacter termitis]|uniref:Uncharacterized protein n=1 Tax=Pilibacter termitis TaxID=263852 RepID=A0A1T4QW20_9ENTE|nr:hypothetical protein [Pilibacter termitis]SKA07904.1 hypothetical protein SAMN02745116_02347 [Pilibacter termitis]
MMIFDFYVLTMVLVALFTGFILPLILLILSICMLVKPNSARKKKIALLLLTPSMIWLVYNVFKIFYFYQ